jgi:phosphatidylinositol alpha-1,6-mannosyltransferase
MIKCDVFLTDAYGINGGIAKYSQDLIAGLVKGGMQLNIIPRNCKKNFERTTAIKISSIASVGKLGFLVATFLSLFRKKNLVICGHINLLPFAFLSAIIGKCPLILMIYGIEVWKPHQNFVINYLLRKIDHIISISKFTEKKLKGWLPGLSAKIFILPNGIDLSLYGIAKKPKDLIKKYDADGKTVLMTMGRLSSTERYKGIDEVLTVFSNLIKKNSNLLYLICGDGDDKSRLMKKASDLGISDFVIFSGYIPEAEKKKYYDLSDLYVMPSYGEGFGFVFLEAMAAGVPVLASINDGGYEAVQYGSLAKVVDAHNSSQIEIAILEMLPTIEKKIPKGLEIFSIERFDRELKNIIMMVLH